MSEEQTVQDSGEDKGDVISRLEAVLESKGQTEEPGDEDEVVAETTDEVVEETTDEVIEETQEETETEATESEEVEKDPTEEEEAAEDDDLEQTVTKGFVDIDGEKISIEEVKLGYLRQADYTKKTQAVAEQRKAAEEQTKSYESTLSALLTAAGADLSRFQNVNWEQAAIENPEQYKQAKAMFDQTQQTFNFIKSQADEHAKRIEEQQQAFMQEKAQESLNVLKSTIPNWNNDLYYKIGDYAQQELGVKADEFNGITDHRSITAIYKAMLFDRAKKETQKKVKTSPKKTLSGKKAEPKSLGKQETYRKARERLKKSGKIEDAVQALMNRTS